MSERCWSALESKWGLLDGWESGRGTDRLNLLVLLGVIRPALKTKWNSLSVLKVTHVACSCV